MEPRAHWSRQPLRVGHGQAVGLYSLATDADANLAIQQQGHLGGYKDSVYPPHRVLHSSLCKRSMPVPSGLFCKVGSRPLVYSPVNVGGAGYAQNLRITRALILSGGGLASTGEDRYIVVLNGGLSPFHRFQVISGSQSYQLSSRSFYTPPCSFVKTFQLISFKPARFRVWALTHYARVCLAHEQTRPRSGHLGAWVLYIVSRPSCCGQKLLRFAMANSCWCNTYGLSFRRSTTVTDYKPPDYEIRALNKETQEKANIGAAWKKPDGSITLVFNPFVTVPTGKKFAITAFPVEGKDARIAEAKKYRPDLTPQQLGYEDEIPF